MLGYDTGPSEDHVFWTRFLRSVLAAHSLRKTYALAVQNYERFNEAEAEIIELIEGSPQSEWPEPTEMGDTLQSHFLNWLSSARAFLESTESQLKRCYGRDSPQVGRFKVATARHYDSKFPYPSSTDFGTTPSIGTGPSSKDAFRWTAVKTQANG